MIKRLYFIFFCLLMATVAEGKVLIVVVKSRDIAPYNIALEGFKRALKRGRINSNIIEYDMKGELKKGQEIIKEVKAVNPDLILILGSNATQVISSSIKDIPIIFSMVLNPVASGFIKSMQSSDNNLTGASMDIPIEMQFEKLRSIIPNLRKIGVLYSPMESKTIIEDASDVAKEMGLVLIAQEVSSEKNVPSALEILFEKRADALWMVADGTVFTTQSSKHILLYTLRNGIPFMGLSLSYVKAGALLALSWDYQDIGRQSGELALRVLSGEEPGQIPITVPRRTSLVLNLKTAKRIGIKIPPSVLTEAEEIFE